MLIHEVAERFGITADTVRYYEKQGLLTEKHVRRRPNGYREYTEAALERIRLIRLGQIANFSLAELRAGIELWESGKLSDEQKAEIWLQQLERLDRQVKALQESRNFIMSKLQQLQKLS
ncbi:MerR family transcriptional regulator [Nostocales cyanobacterium LEGE 11386]|nr:MerR family transcriptional regulator [Nostocales cyanobacterium LEGE 11386]